jgi:flagellar biosynthesis/type III secretory pathway protein FliH
VNISIKELSTMRTSLEKEYEKMEREINSLLVEGNNEAADKLIKKQDIVDMKIDLVDRIIKNLQETPKLYEKLIELSN